MKQRRLRRPDPPASPAATGSTGNLPERTEKLHKVLAHAGIASRRVAESWIKAGRVTVNGAPAHVGDRVAPRDSVRVDGREVSAGTGAKAVRVLVYHKPVGELVTRDDPEGRDTVFANLPTMTEGRWIAVGRLDLNTSGLLVFTNSGDLADRLMHPRANLEREYAVRVLGSVDAAQRLRLMRGVMLDDGVARFLRIDEAGGTGANRWYRVSLTEGRNREVRRLFEAVGCTVNRLIRLRFGPITLPRGLAQRRSKELTAAEVADVLASLAQASRPSA